jgi:hypothetical protein
MFYGGPKFYAMQSSVMSDESVSCSCWYRERVGSSSCLPLAAVDSCCSPQHSVGSSWCPGRNCLEQLFFYQNLLIAVVGLKTMSVTAVILLETANISCCPQESIGLAAVFPSSCKATTASFLYVSKTISIDGHVSWTANVEYRLSFADQGKQTSAFRFPYIYIYWNDSIYIYICNYIYKDIDISRYRCVYISRVYIYIYLYIYVYLSTYVYKDIYAAISNGKRKPRRFFLILLPLTYRVNGSLSFLRLFTKRQTELIRLQTN